MFNSDDGELSLLKTAVACGYLTEAQFDECVGIRDRTEERPALIAVRKGYMTQGQLLALVSGKTEPLPPIPGFQIESRLRRGGMGTVYKARESGSGRLVALKVLNRSVSSRQRLTQRFVKEAATCGRVQHPNLVAAYEVANVGALTYYVMDFVPGVPVDEWILKHGRLDERRSLDIVRQIALALGALNRENLVHCDVKPSNIIVLPDGTAKLCDLGVARARDGETVRINGLRAIVGTPSYMSPEQVEGKKDLDIRSDLYSLGAVLFTMLIGRPPYIGKNAAGTMQKHLSAPVPNPKELRSDLSVETSDLIMRCIRKDREDRFQSPDEFVEALDRARGRDRARRTEPSRWAFRVVSAAAVAVAMGTAGLVWHLQEQAVRARPGSFVPIVRNEADTQKTGSMCEQAEQWMAADRWVEAARLLERLVTEYRVAEAAELLARANREIDALRAVADFDESQGIDALERLQVRTAHTRVARLHEPRWRSTRIRLAILKEGRDRLNALRSSVEREDWAGADEHLAYLRSGFVRADADFESLGYAVDRHRERHVEDRVAQLLRLAEAEFAGRRWNAAAALYQLARHRYGASVRDRAGSIDERLAACDLEAAREREERAGESVALAFRYAEQEDWARTLVWLDYVLADHTDSKLVRSRCRDLESLRADCVKRLRSAR